MLTTELVRKTTRKKLPVPMVFSFFLFRNILLFSLLEFKYRNSNNDEKHFWKKKKIKISNHEKKKQKTKIFVHRSHVYSYRMFKKQLNTYSILERKRKEKGMKKKEETNFTVNVVVQFSCSQVLFIAIVVNLSHGHVLLFFFICRINEWFFSVFSFSFSFWNDYLHTEMPLI